MRRPHVEPFLGRHLHPTVGNTAAGKDERVHAAAIIDDGELEIAVERRGRYVLPHCAMFRCTSACRIDLNHVVAVPFAAPARARRRMSVATPDRTRLAPRGHAVAHRQAGQGAAEFDLDQIRSGGIRGCSAFIRTSPGTLHCRQVRVPVFAIARSVVSPCRRANPAKTWRISTLSSVSPARRSSAKPRRRRRAARRGAERRRFRLILSSGVARQRTCRAAKSTVRRPAAAANYSLKTTTKPNGAEVLRRACPRLQPLRHPVLISLNTTPAISVMVHG